MTPFWIFLAIWEGIMALILCSVLAGFRRGNQSASSWLRATAHIKTFGLSDGIPDVIYEYNADRIQYTSRAIVPGPFFKPNSGQVKQPRACYLNSDGSLKFSPGTDVDVYYNPRNPADAALVPGVQLGSTLLGIATVLAFATAPLVLYYNQKWASNHAMELAGWGFLLAALIVLGFGMRLLTHCLQTRRYPFVTGRLIKAEVAYSSGSENGGYTPVVEYEYKVDGKLYQSRQLAAISIQVLTSRQNAQAKVDVLLASPDIQVYYNPRAPWEAFLRPGPYLGLAIPAVMSFAFAGFGLFVLFKR